MDIGIEFPTFNLWATYFQSFLLVYAITWITAGKSVPVIHFAQIRPKRHQAEISTLYVQSDAEPSRKVASSHQRKTEMHDTLVFRYTAV